LKIKVTLFLTYLIVFSKLLLDGEECIGE